MGYNAAYENIVTQVAALLSSIDSIKKVWKGKSSAFRLTKTPMAIIEPPEETAYKETTDLFRLEGVFDVYIIIRETEPENWFTEISAITGAVIDAVMANRTLNKAVKDCWWIFHSPGQITIDNRLFYGGVVRFQETRFYPP